MTAKYSMPVASGFIDAIGGVGFCAGLLFQRIPNGCKLHVRGGVVFGLSFGTRGGTPDNGIDITAWGKRKSLPGPWPMRDAGRVGRTISIRRDHAGGAKTGL